MSEEEIQQSIKKFESHLRAWNQEQSQVKNGYEYEAGFDKFITGYSKELFQASMGKRGKSRNSKKK